MVTHVGRADQSHLISRNQRGSTGAKNGVPYQHPRGISQGIIAKHLGYGGKYHMSFAEKLIIFPVVKNFKKPVKVLAKFWKSSTAPF